MLRQIIILATLCTGLFSAEALAQSKTQPCEDDVYRQFDFWLGTWEVHDPAGAVQGTNIITAEEYGCLLVERWTNKQGQTGQSYNFYDPAIAKWRQIWVSAGVVIDYAGGLNEAGAMVLAGEIAYRKSGQTFPFKGTWTPQANGQIRQHFQQFDPMTDKWNDWFIGLYTLKEKTGE